jgi:hypothetical protein
MTQKEFVGRAEKAMRMLLANMREFLTPAEYSRVVKLALSDEFKVTKKRKAKK